MNAIQYLKDLIASEKEKKDGDQELAESMLAMAPSCVVVTHTGAQNPDYIDNISVYDKASGLLIGQFYHHVGSGVGDFVLGSQYEPLQRTSRITPEDLIRAGASQGERAGSEYF